MALAYLKYQKQTSDSYVFLADVGTAKYFRYSIATMENGKVNEKLLSKFFKINNKTFGSFLLQIPTKEINKTDCIRLFSYTKKEFAPQRSNCIRINSNKTIEKTVKNLSINMDTLQHIETKNTEFNYKEPHYSETMFWGALVSALPAVIKYGAPIISSLFSKKKKNTAKPSGKKSDISIDMILKILQELMAKPPVTSQSLSNEPATISLEPSTFIKLKPIIEKILSPEAILAIGDDPKKLFFAIKDAVNKTEAIDNLHNNKSILSNSSSFDIGSLVNSLPSIFKSVDKVGDLLNSTNVNDIHSNLFNTNFNSFNDISSLLQNLQNNPLTGKQAINDTLPSLLKAVGDIVFKINKQQLHSISKAHNTVIADNSLNFIKSLSIPSESASHRPTLFRMSKNYDLYFTHTKTVAFKNKKRVLYNKNSKIVVPFIITSDSNKTDNTILKKSIIQIEIKDAKSLKVYLLKKIRLINVDIKNEIKEAFLSSEEIQNIPTNTELKFELSFIWVSDTTNEPIGVFKNHYVYFVDTYLYDRISKPIGVPVLFNDINQHRDYWHKIWEGGFSKSRRWQIEFDLKYFFLLDSSSQHLSRLETRKLITSDNMDNNETYPSRRVISAKLKSGVSYNLETINHALELVGEKKLSPIILDVLKNVDFEKEFHQEARQHVKLKGRLGDTATLWAYPEMLTYNLLLFKIAQTDTLGQVTSIIPITKQITKPEYVHFIGTKSER